MWNGQEGRWKYQLDKWQKKWEQETGKAGWTKKLIPDIGEWVNRKEGETTFRLTQFLLGHGAFGKYRDRIGKAETAKCCGCGYEQDDILLQKNEGKGREVE